MTPYSYDQIFSLKSLVNYGSSQQHTRHKLKLLITGSTVRARDRPPSSLLCITTLAFWCRIGLTSLGPGVTTFTDCPSSFWPRDRTFGSRRCRASFARRLASRARSSAMGASRAPAKFPSNSRPARPAPSLLICAARESADRRTEENNGSYFMNAPGHSLAIRPISTFVLRGQKMPQRSD